MYENAGGAIKAFAQVLLWVGIALSLIIALLLLLLVGMDDIILIIVVLIVGPLLSWLSNLFIYAFGEAVECLTSMEEEVSSIGNDIAFLKEISSDLNAQVSKISIKDFDDEAVKRLPETKEEISSLKNDLAYLKKAFSDLSEQINKISDNTSDDNT